MRRTTVRVVLVPVLGGLIFLGGCTTLESDGYWASSYPVYPRGGYVYEQSYRNPDGLMVFYDPGVSLYSVSSYPGLYWHDGYYYRKQRGHWERSRHRRGPWAIQHQAPPRVVVRPQSPPNRPRPTPVVVPDRRPVYGVSDRDPRDWPLRPTPERRPTYDPGHQRVRVSPGPQNVPYVRRPDPGRDSPPVNAPVGPRQVVRRPAVRPSPGEVIGPRPVVVPQGPDGLRRGPVPSDRGWSGPARRTPSRPGDSSPVSRPDGTEGPGALPPRVRGSGADRMPYQQTARRPGDAPVLGPGARRSNPREGDAGPDERPYAPVPPWGQRRQFPDPGGD